MYLKGEEEESLSNKYPEISEQWHPTKNLSIKPNMVRAYSDKKIWWQCKKGHEWVATIGNRVIGSGCPYCSGRRVCDDNSLQTLHPKIAKEWHPTKNGDLLPSGVTVSSSKKVWWQCKKEHEWQAAIYSRINGNGCPFCSGRYASADNCLQKSNPKLAKEWHPIKNGDLAPNDVTANSGKKVWWKCKKGHEWVATIGNRASGRGCPFCSGRYASTDNCLRILNPKLAKEWHPIKNGELTPSDVTPSSGKKVWWKCKKGHEWEARVADRNSGTGCPYCSGKRI